MKISKSQLMKYILHIIPSVLAVVFIILFINANSEINKTKNQYENIVKNLDNEKQALVAENKKLIDSHKNIGTKQTNSIFLSAFDIQNIKKKGLADPVQALTSDLKKHNELIPYKGVNGGTMSFYGDNSVWILTSKWVLAYFEDGHISSYILLEYNISDNGVISWKRIASMMS